MRGIRLLGTASDAAILGLVVLTLALGVGGTTAVFTVVDGLLLRPLPYAEADRLLEVWTEEMPAARRVPGLRPDVFRALRGASPAFDAVEASQFGAATLTGEGGGQDRRRAPRHARASEAAGCHAASGSAAG